MCGFRFLFGAAEAEAEADGGAEGRGREWRGGKEARLATDIYGQEQGQMQEWGQEMEDALGFGCSMGLMDRTCALVPQREVDMKYSVGFFEK